MGNFVPKPPFNLAEFLSKKATPQQARFRGRPATRYKSAATGTAEDPEDLARGNDLDPRKGTSSDE